jgi:DNA helicase-2/ATP-dependent DNA helicase PcrA
MVKEKCTYTARDVHNKISFAKGKGFSAVEYTADYVLKRNAGLSLDLHSEQLPYNIRLVAGIFREYDAELRQLNALDFDDLLIFGVKLVREHNEVVHWCRHVLVDE